MRYRRSRTDGGTYFFTVNLADRTSTLLVDRVDALRACVAQVKQRHPFIIDAWVVLPDHLHVLWTMPPDDHDYAKRWMLIKAGFSRSLPRLEAVSVSRARKGERGIWQRRYWEHEIRDEEDFRRHLDYIHINPVKHGCVVSPSQWKWSSVHRFVREGLLPADWGAEVKPDDGPFGER